MTRRYDQAAVFRDFAKRVRRMRFRDSESYVSDLDQLAADMEARADVIVRADEPAPESVFRTGAGHSAAGKPFRAETRQRSAC